MKKYEDVKTLEEVQKLAVKDFELPLEALSFNVVKETKGFLGIGAKLEVEVDVALDGIEEGKKYIQVILDNNGVKGFIEKKVRGNNVEFNVDAGEFNGYLIGKNSRNLVSLQNFLPSVHEREACAGEGRPLYHSMCPCFCIPYPCSRLFCHPHRGY